MKPGRIPCEILGCRRTAAEAKFPASTRIICGKHFRQGKPRDILLYRRAHRKIKRLMSPDGADAGRKAQLESIAHHAWDRIRIHVTNIAVGIS